ncbi:MAG: hypothetical protein HC831_10575 [Chloroflexia bacterium]|nr:hypothetical protein [Chloroflexia bacterium]
MFGFLKPPVYKTKTRNSFIVNARQINSLTYISMKIKTLILVIATLFNIGLIGQTKPTVLKYIGLSNGLIDSSKTLEIIYSNDVCYLSGSDDDIQEFIDYKRSVVVDIMEFDKKKYKTVVAF